MKIFGATGYLVRVLLAIGVGVYALYLVGGWSIFWLIDDTIGSLIFGLSVWYSLILIVVSLFHAMKYWKYKSEKRWSISGVIVGLAYLGVLTMFSSVSIFKALAIWMLWN